MRWFIHPLVILAAALLVLVAYDETWLMPGPLSAPHQGFTTPCSNCHPGFADAPNASCLSCKIDMGYVDFHGIHRYAPVKKCTHCHQEHRGRKFNLAGAWVDPLIFDHAWTGFPLTGYHYGLACPACHKPGVPYNKVPYTCTGCHTNFKPGDFDHAQTGCRLDDQHKNLPCKDCHTKGWGENLRATCTKCHPDAGYKPRQVCIKEPRPAKE